MFKKLTLTMILSLTMLSTSASAKVNVKTNQLQPKGTELNKAPKAVQNDTKAVDELVEKLQTIKTLSANFSKTIIGSDDKDHVMSGSLLIKRPDLFIWDTKKPYSQTIYAGNGKIWNVDHSIMQVVIQNQGKDTENTPVQLLSGNARKFLQNYSVTVEQQRAERSFTLRPLSINDTLFKSLTLHFKEGKLIGFSMLDGLGNHNKIDLENVMVNQPINDSRFKPEYPKKYDVIDKSIVREKAG
ncbi:MAG: outer membrane lipoprotein chaperone LolA [Endozoicomonas sp. (ex Botrylloides leachii)]|nr:outer membrane lipoprotein chaperone LolA [Endozoicomonas sp. (ex Botrylloides leachii)]